MRADKYDSLDVQQLVQSALDAFCERHNLTTREAKQKALTAIAAAAKELKGMQ